jgi:hypothetical protein
MNYTTFEYIMSIVSSLLLGITLHLSSLNWSMLGTDSMFRQMPIYFLRTYTKLQSMCIFHLQISKLIQTIVFKHIYVNISARFTIFAHTYSSILPILHYTLPSGMLLQICKQSVNGYKRLLHYMVLRNNIISTTQQSKNRFLTSTF